MAEHWQSLVANLAVVALFISTWVHGQFVFNARPRWQKRAAFGLTMGLGAVASMLLAIPVDGALFDLRLSLLAIAGFFGGPVAGGVALLVAGIVRLTLGGDAAGLGVLSMLIVALGGHVISRATRRRISPLVSAALLAALPPATSLTITALLHWQGALPFAGLSLPVAAMNVAATGLSAFFIMRYRVVERERDLLRAAFLQSGDLRFVKTVDGRYAAANNAMAQRIGIGSPAKMIGRTDFDLLELALAERVAADDNAVLASGQGFREREEIYHDVHGNGGWYAISKMPLYDRDGKLIGLEGSTREITKRKRLETEVEESRNQLNYVLTEVTDGIAMFDAGGTLVYCNQQYRDMFPLTAEARRPGVNLRDILALVAETREQSDIPEGPLEGWIDAVLATLRDGDEQEIRLYDGRWLRIGTRPVAHGGLVVVQDITRSKQTEAALVSMTERLRQLAETDGLTGLANRRSLDETLTADVLRARQAGSPFSVLMCDVDHFKAYNDRYGHQAGDEVLTSVARCLARVLRRPGDMAARYGGEEFVAVLPDTGEAGAVAVAEAFRAALHKLALPHRGSGHGIVTTSIGIATLADGDGPLDAAMLLKRADEALYAGKKGGRDRIVTWQEPPPARARA